MSKARKWYYHPVFVHLIIILVFPVGLILAWRSPRVYTWWKWTVTIVIGLAFLSAMFNAPDQQNDDNQIARNDQPKTNQPEKKESSASKEPEEKEKQNKKEKQQKERSKEQKTEKEKPLDEKFPTIGDNLQTRYFEVKLNEAKVTDRVNTGNQFTSKESGSDNTFVILSVTFKNTDTESRMIDAGELVLQSGQKTYRFDKTVTIPSDGWGVFFDQINPMTVKETRLVWQIPRSLQGNMFWVPGRNPENRAFFVRKF